MSDRLIITIREAAQLSQPIELDREAIRVYVEVAEHVARKRRAAKAQRRGNLHSVEDDKAA